MRVYVYRPADTRPRLLLNRIGFERRLIGAAVVAFRRCFSLVWSGKAS